MMQKLVAESRWMVDLTTSSGKEGSKVVTVRTSRRGQHSCKQDNQLVDLLTWTRPIRTLTR